MIKDASIEIIQRCENHCIHCSSCSCKTSKAILPYDEVEKVIVGLQRLGIQRVCFSGGEPLLHPEIEKMVQCASTLGIEPNIYSSGICIVSGEAASIPEDTLLKLKESGLTRIMYNFQSVCEERYNQITQTVGHLPLAIESLRKTLRCGIEAEIHFVPMKCNLCDIESIIHFAEKEHVNQVSFLKMMPHGRAKDNLESIYINDSENLNLQQQLLNLRDEGLPIRIGLPLSLQDSVPPCHAVKEKLYIKFDGSVFGCEAFKYIDFKDPHGAAIRPDSIFEKDIQKIYSSSEYLKYSKQLVDFYESEKSNCENCPVQKYLKAQREKNGL